MKILLRVLLLVVFTVPIFAQKSTSSRLQAAAEDLNAMVNAGDKRIPQDLLDKARCVVVIPNLKKGGFVVGGEYGKGFFSCRRPNGNWGAPGAVRISGGKFGFLVGGAETDVLMLVMNQDGMQHLLSDKFQMRGEAAAAAGPVGRESSATTDAAMHAEILTYSRSRGILAGLTSVAQPLQTTKMQTVSYMDARLPIRRLPMETSRRLRKRVRLSKPWTGYPHKDRNELI